MNPERWRRIEELFHLAHECDPTGRAAFLEHACGGDDDLRREVESLLEQGDSAHSFLMTHPMAGAPFAEDLSGRQFGPYQVVGPLGEGGMARVYRAYQHGVDRFVALKVLSQQRRADPQFRRRFRHEARIVGQFRHPHILPVFDFGETEDGYTFFAMPLIEGGTLAGMLKGRPFQLPRTERIVRQVCEALDYSHSKGIVHRDIKPSNILIDERDNCLVADFGLAQMHDSSRLTLTGALLGTPAYMSPEQAAGRDVGPHSDLYSLGIVLYELLTGRVPFRAETPLAVALKHLSAPLPPPGRLNPALTPSLEAVVLKALARSPADRFASGEKLAASLSAAVREFEELTTARDMFWPQTLAGETAEAADSLRGDPTSNSPVVTDRLENTTLLIDRSATSEPVGRRADQPLQTAARHWLAWLVAAVVGTLLFGGVYFMNRGTERLTPEATPSAHGDLTASSSGQTTGASLIATTGTLLIDALPWAEVAEIRNANGQVQRVAPQTYTPVSVLVPAGVYRVTLKHPASSRTQVLTVVVAGGGTQRAFAEFERIDADDYFQKVGWPVTR